MIDFGPVSTDLMVLYFLQAELASSRFKDYVVKSLSKLGVRESIVTRADLEDKKENSIRRRLLGYRGYETRTGLFSRFPTRVRWRMLMTEGKTDFDRLTFMNYPDWNELSGGSGRVVSVSGRLVNSSAWRVRAGHIHSMRKELDRGVWFPPLIACSTGTVRSGDIVLIEGHSRATAYHLLRSYQDVKVLVAFSRRVEGWEFFPRGNGYVREVA